MRALLLLLSLCLSGACAAQELRLTNGEWAPYLGAKLPHQGVASRIVAEAFALEGIDVRWEFYPWARALRLAERGERDGSAVWLRNPEREARFFVSDPVIESGYYLFHRKDLPLDWQRVEDLAGLRLGATLGYDYGEAFQRAEAEGRLQVQRLPSEEQGLRMLLAGRIDVFPVDKIVAIAMLQDNFTSAERARVSFHAQPLRSDTLHLLLSRADPANAERMARFNQGLAHLRESGKVARYLLEAQQPLSMLP
ncbi:MULTISPECIES: substrate-binding periplasmic protein [unclassified Pseudomonas]|uniref:substrate-binding periplasmic protein n=1 Tax=unclassified Pseudomonas TaxID=196821 RepID=UPI000DA72D63|nr:MULTISPECIES: transporter substrate-binding domain-containing protein [unclassified Pseudomonas]MDW3710524.1 transporter substrate-binding domain-containing protein [Pseudomonas sp. 2023EL-01195]PZE14089.1 amino acid ABC transporter substrate-binding protein [Pseudomonas sp. 57B-090624]